MGIARRSLVISVTRFANQGLILISPIVLVRLLTVADFGRYREFLLYVGILTSICAFGINSSLLYFVPAHAASAWRFVRQAIILTAANSIVVSGALIGLNHLFGGALVGEYAAPVAIYVLLFVNFDFWEYLWLARRRTTAVFAYTTGRLVARMLVVISAALLTADVGVIIGSLIALEAVRLVVSIIAWRIHGRNVEEPIAGAWRNQLRYCGPVGAALILVTFNKSLASLFIAKLMGPIALAHYTIGTYVQPVVTVLRNSISDVVLPEMAAQKLPPGLERLSLWRRSTIMSAGLLLPAGILLGRYAETILVTVFSEGYRAAAAVLQIYLLVLIREIFDFGVPLRAINTTTPIVQGNLAALGCNLVLLLSLLPIAGLAGAVSAYVASRFVEGAWLGWRTARLYEVSLAQLVCWPDLLRVGIAAAGAALLLAGSTWTDLMGPPGIVVASIAYLLAFVLLLRVLRLPEVVALLRRRLPPLSMRSSES